MELGGEPSSKPAAEETSSGKQQATQEPKSEMIQKDTPSQAPAEKPEPSKPAPKPTEQKPTPAETATTTQSQSLGSREERRVSTHSS